MRFLAALSIATTVGGLILAFSGAPLPGAFVFLFGLLLGGALGAVAAARSVTNSVREWRSLISGGGPESVRVLAVEPPQGFIFRNEASVTLELRGQDGTTKQIRKGIPIPPVQAFLWRVAGRVPTPLGKLTDKRELDFALYRKRGAKA